MRFRRTEGKNEEEKGKFCNIKYGGGPKFVKNTVIRKKSDLKELGEGEGEKTKSGWLNRKTLKEFDKGPRVRWGRVISARRTVKLGKK